MSTINFFLGGYPKIPNCIEPNYHFCSQKHQYRVHKSPSIVPVLSYSNPVHKLTPPYFRITRERQNVRTLKLPRLLGFSATILYACFNSPTFTIFPFHPSTLMTMISTNYDNYHNTICYYLLLLIPFYISTLYSAPCSQTHAKNKSLFPKKNNIRMSLMCTTNKWFSWNLRRRMKRPNTYGPFWILWYHCKTFGGQSVWCYRSKAGSTSVPNYRESLKSSKSFTVIMHIKCLH
jgi:hypothetical protein